MPHASKTIRIMMAIAVGLLMFGITYGTAFERFRESYEYHSVQSDTIRGLRALRVLLDQHLSESGSLPIDFLQFNRDNSETLERYFVVDEYGWLRDPWNHRVAYRVRNNEYRVLSFGLDGKEGGTGADSDLDGTEVPGTPSLQPTFGQFVRSLCPQGMYFACVITGGIAAALCLLPMGRKRNAPASIGTLVLSVVVAVAVTWYLGAILVVLHVPSGH
jgi:hypothetical protein